MTSPLTDAAHVRDLLRTLADEGDHQEDVRVVGGDAVGDVLEEHRLAGLGRADDERPLALADRVDEVDQPLAEVLRVRLEVDQLVRVDRRQVAEVGPAAGDVAIDAVDRVDAEQAPVLLRLARRADGAGDAVADAQAEAAHLAGVDVDVLGAGQQAVAAHEAVALVDDVEDAGGVVETGVARSGAGGSGRPGRPCAVGSGVDLELAADLAQLGDAHLAEVADIEVVALAGSFELLQLVVLRDRQTGGLRPSTRSTVTRTLVGAVGHGRGTPQGADPRWRERLGHGVREPRARGRRANPRGARPSGEYQQSSAASDRRQRGVLVRHRCSTTRAVTR